MSIIYYQKINYFVSVELLLDDDTETLDDELEADDETEDEEVEVTVDKDGDVVDDDVTDIVADEDWLLADDGANTVDVSGNEDCNDPTGAAFNTAVVVGIEDDVAMGIIDVADCDELALNDDVAEEDCCWSIDSVNTLGNFGSIFFSSFLSFSFVVVFSPEGLESAAEVNVDDAAVPAIGGDEE